MCCRVLEPRLPKGRKKSKELKKYGGRRGATAERGLMNTNPQTARLLGYIQLQPGIKPIPGYTVLFACLTGIPFLVIINFIQPYILTAMLDIPTRQHGSLSGYLAILHEIIMVLLTSPIGALADRVGRRRILGSGYIIAAAGLMIYPWATSVIGLMLIRCIYAVGAAAIVSSYSILLADYPQEKSRGKLIAMAGVLNGLGILIITFIGGNLPAWLVSMDFGPITAGRLALGLVGIACIISGIIVVLGLRGGDRGIASGAEKQAFRSLLRQGFGAARNPRIAVSYASAFAGRGDVVVIGTSVSLWGTPAGMARGMTEADALAKATIVFAVLQTASLLAAPLIGILNDRINRVTALVFGMTLAAIGYIAFGLQADPFSGNWLPIAIVLGIGQISAVLAGTTLIGQEADPKITGVTIGVWSFCGALGTMAGSLVGGLIYDMISPGAPFLMMGIANLIVALATYYVRIKYPQHKALDLS
jgi:MFS family permease